VSHPVAPSGPAHAAVIARIEADAASTRWSTASVRETLEHAATRGWVVYREDEVVGHLLTRIAGPTAEVLTLAILPSARRQGRAVALLGAAEATWRQSGVEDAFLEVRRSNDAARALYQQLGWEEIGSRPGYYSDGEDAVLMRWDA